MCARVQPFLQRNRNSLTTIVTSKPLFSALLLCDKNSQFLHNSIAIWAMRVLEIRFQPKHQRILTHNSYLTLTTNFKKKTKQVRYAFLRLETKLKKLTNQRLKFLTDYFSFFYARTHAFLKHAYSCILSTYLGIGRRERSARLRRLGV